MTKEAAAPQGAAEAKLILYGRDDAGKPHASWFAEADAELATKAAGLMTMAVLPVTSDEARALALQLPAGRIFESGKGFVPFVKKVNFEALVALGGEPPKPSAKPKPAEPAGEVEAEVEALTHTSVPTSWDEVAPGGLVLAPNGDEAWYSAVVTEDRGDDVFILRWRGWPDEPPFVRRREHLALVRGLIEDAS